MPKKYTLTYLDLEDKQLVEYIKGVYNESFPESERRHFDENIKILSTDSPYDIVVINKDKTPIGLLTYWQLNGFVYIEHFAVDKDKRGGGAGKNAMEQFKKIIPSPIVLEVEPPEDEMSVRRIKFYKKLGFYLWDKFPYIQPPYYKGGESLNLILMTYGDLNLYFQYKDIVTQIYYKVYKANPEEYMQI